MKQIEDMTFDELVDSATWNIIQGLMKGEPLRSLVYQVVSTLARLWKQQTKWQFHNVQYVSYQYHIWAIKINILYVIRRNKK